MTKSAKEVSTVQDSNERVETSGEKPFRLRLVHSPDSSRAHSTVELESGLDVLAIGRDPGAFGLGVDDPRMSRLHARIAWDRVAGAFRFGDANSSNGCYLNGIRTATALLGEGDLLRLGDTLVVFEQDAKMAALNETVARVAPSNLALLITGESGTGKELIARRIHELSGRQGQFVAINCAALHRELVTSELFGHTRGAFSNATHARGGLFLAAQDGTLLLDEIGDLPLDQQPALLRVLQEHKVRPVGSDREITTTARVLAATHVDLEQRARNAEFRPDLLARLGQCVLRVPALRERRGDVLQLARLFAERAGRDLELSAEAAERLVLWHWPFNVRELENLIETFCVLTDGTLLDGSFLRERFPSLLNGPEEPEAPRMPRADSERRDRLQRLLAENSGNISAVARILGKPRAQIYRWLRRYGIAPAGPSGAGPTSKP